MSIKQELAGRLGFVYLLVVLVAVAIVVKALHVQVWDGDYWRGRSAVYSFKDFIVPPNRGDICAEDGRPLSSSIPYYTVRFDGVMVKDSVFKRDIDSLALCLSAFFGDQSKAAYKNKIVSAREAKKPNRYLRINTRRVTYTELKELKRFPIFRERGKRNGLVLEQEQVRVHLHGQLAERTIGYLNEGDDGLFRGRVGLEEAYEKELCGVNGRSIQQMMSGRRVPVTVEEPVDGHDVITTINVDYQDIVQNALLGQLKHYQADAGTAILMEVETGDIKAIANLSKTAKGYKEVLNNAIGDAAEPGSVFKAAIMVALLEDGFVTPADSIDLGKGLYTYYGRTMPESSRNHIGTVSVQQVFERSLNGISRLVTDHYKTQPEKLVEHLRRMGLGEPVGVELLGEGKPLIKSPKSKDWYGTTLPWMSIGYEVKQTPLQILTFYNALANGGRRMKPRLVKEIRHKGELIKRFPTEETHRAICSRQTLQWMRQMMEGVVENGTARNLRGTPYGIAGKTGTARIAAGAGGYGERKYRASFVGYFPADKPLYTCIVVVENPSTAIGYYGNVVSGNVFREISDKVYTWVSLKEGKPEPKTKATLPVSRNGRKADFAVIYEELGLPLADRSARENEWVTTTRDTAQIILTSRKVDFSVVPDVRGMGLRDALYLLENSGLKVGAGGAGSVVSQSVPPGSKVSKGSYIAIELR